VLKRALFLVFLLPANQFEQILNEDIFLLVNKIIQNLIIQIETM
jgi:hypothetical protein